MKGSSNDNHGKQRATNSKTTVPMLRSSETSEKQRRYGLRCLKLATEKEWLGYPQEKPRPASKLAWVVGVLLLLILAASANAERTGVYSIEQECSTGYCPNTAGPASCFTVGYDARGGTCVVTAKHCTTQVANRFYVVNDSGLKTPAVVVWRSPSLDIAVLRVAKKLSLVPVRLDTPPTGVQVKLKGVISRRYQESSGTVKQIESSGRIWFTGLWSHPGMSGGALTDFEGRIFGVHHSKVVGSRETIGVEIRTAVEQYERSYGRLELAKGSIRLQQSPRLNQSIFRKCDDPNCPKCGNGRQVDCVPVQIPIPRQRVDYDRVAREVFERYGDRLRGQDGANGRDGSNGSNGTSPQLDIDELADVITSRYADRIRGQRGNDGSPGQRGKTGPAGQEGPRGFVGVPDDVDIQQWLVGALSNPESRKAIAAIVTEFVVEDPRTESILNRIENLERKKTIPQRVLIVDGASGTVLDDEEFGPGEPIVLDVRKLQRAN